MNFVNSINFVNIVKWENQSNKNQTSDLRPKKRAHTER